MNQRFTVMIVSLAFALFVQPATAVDTDGDGLLDLIDVPGFDPSARGMVIFSPDIEDLDGASLLSDVQELYLGGNQITSIESGDFAGLTNLERLWLTGNQITSIESGTFDGLDNLQELWLDVNPIASIESGAFDGLTNLQTLWLGWNQITRIESGAFIGLSKLENLSLSIKLAELNLTRATFENLIPCVGPFEPGGFCMGNSFTGLVLNDAKLSRSSFDAILARGFLDASAALSDTSLVGLTFSDEYPSDLSQLLGISTLDNVTVDQSLFDRYADEFNAFAAMEGNSVTIVPEPSSAMLFVVGLLALRRRL